MEDPDTAPPSSWVDADWTRVCALDDIVPNTGVCALLDGRQIAVVRVGEGEEVYAIDNFDPFSKAFVLSRGIVGDRKGVPKIASPIFKQSFSLLTGECLEKPEVAIPIYPARVRHGEVEVSAPTAPEKRRAAPGARHR
ncbi:MAG TPA: nitrite reductase small subunit NirD [Polyangia bacterium]|nr:nitrite reductase small subunit NirD [Polyangia bacterium]